MHWVAQSAKDTASEALGKRPWDTAEQFHGNSGLKSQKCSATVLDFEGDHAGRDHGGNVNSYDDEPRDAPGRFDCTSHLRRVTV